MNDEVDHGPAPETREPEILEIGGAERAPRRRWPLRFRRPGRRLVVTVLAVVTLVSALGYGGRLWWDSEHTFTAAETLAAIQPDSRQSPAAEVGRLTTAELTSPPALDPADCSALFAPGLGAVDGVERQAPVDDQGQSSAPQVEIARFDDPALVRTTQRRLRQALDRCDGRGVEPADAGVETSGTSVYTVNGLTEDWGDRLHGSVSWQVSVRFSGGGGLRFNVSTRPYGNCLLIAYVDADGDPSTDPVGRAALASLADHLDVMARSR